MEENTKGQEGERWNLDSIIAERERLDKAFKEQFEKVVSVMFTDLKDSTVIAEAEGDFSSRALLKHMIDITVPLIKQHNGTLVKTMGDGTMSYFPTPQEAVRAAAEIQKGIDAFNFTKTLKTPILMRIGIHTGIGIVEENDIFGDVVNVAARFETAANPGEICISEETFNGLSDKAEIYCRYVKEVQLKGITEPMKLYKAFWNPEEIENDISGKRNEAVQEEDVKKGLPLITKIILFVVIPLIVFFIILKSAGFFKIFSAEEKRSIERTIDPPIESGK